MIGIGIKMFSNNKHVFWQALVVALVIFWTGIILVVMFEQSRADRLQQFYFSSETEIFDLLVSQKLISDLNSSCRSAQSKIFILQIKFLRKQENWKNMILLIS